MKQGRLSELAAAGMTEGSWVRFWTGFNSECRVHGVGFRPSCTTKPHTS